MYHALLTRRYLLRKVIPLLAMLSVALCTAMVIIVLSVMSGFLRMVQSAGRALIGDVAVDVMTTGFPYYEELIERVEALPEAESASPVISGYGLVAMPYDRINTVQVFGIEPESYDRVTGFADTLYWRPLSPEEAAEAPEQDLRVPPDASDPDAHVRSLRRVLHDPQYGNLLERIAEAGRRLRNSRDEPGAVLGIQVSAANKRLKGGYYDAGWFMPHHEVTLSVLPLDLKGGVIGAESRVLPVLNEFTVNRHDVDSSYVFVPFDLLQRMLHLQPRMEVSTTAVDEFGDPLPTGKTIPGRTTSVIIKAAPGVPADALRTKVAEIYEQLHAEHPTEMPDPEFVYIRTWEQQIAGFIGAVKKETALVTTLFAIISLVSVFLVLAIFWTIVQQKTRDIGILMAVGASPGGIAWLFLRYGLVLGIVGSTLGGILAHLIVWNINPLHEFVGEVTNVYIWDPAVYYFNELPNTVSPLHAAVIMAGGIVFSVVGALIPAIRAGLIDPVAALRYE